MEKYEKRKQFIINVIFYSVIGAAVILVCRYILPAVLPFIVAFLIGAVMQAPIKKIGAGSRKRQRIAAILFCFLFYAMFFLLIIILGIELLQGAGTLIASAPSVYNEKIVPVLWEVADRVETMAASVDAGLSQKVEEVFREFSQNTGQYITELSVKAVKILSGGAARIPGMIVSLVVTVVSTFFIALDFEMVTGFIRKFIPAEKEKAVGKTAAYVKHILFIYMRSYVFLFLLTFLELLAGFLLLRIPYAAALAFAIAVFDILPVLGTGGILLPWAAVLALLGNVSLAVGMLALYIFITVIRNTLEPKIVGKQIGLHPLATLIFMFVGLKALGIVGMVVFPVVLSLIVNLEKNGAVHIFAKKTAD